MPALTRLEYDRLRSEFLDWAWSQGLKAGSDEFGYHDDEPKAAEAWRQWFEDAKARKVTANVEVTGGREND